MLAPYRANMGYGPRLNLTKCTGTRLCHRAHVSSLDRTSSASEGHPHRLLYPTICFVFCLLPIRTGNCATFFILFLVDYDNLKFTLLISAGSRTFSRRQSAAIELFAAAATFSVLIHLLTQVRGGIGQDSGRVLTRTLGEYFSGGDPAVSSSHRLIIMDLH